MIAGIDLGGTTFKIGFYDGNSIVDFKKVDTQREQGYEHVISRIVETILESNYEINSVGIGSPGSIDRDTRILRYSPNFPNWKNVDIVNDMKKLLNCEVFIENDANIFALGEYYFGKAKGIENFVSITLGTGIGGGIFVDGKLLIGANGFGGEVGHMKLSPNGPLCGCGKRGCFEAWCSSENIKRRYNSLFNVNLDTPQILQMNDIKSLEFLDETFKMMAIGISNLINIFNPSKVILGGGMTKSSNLFIEKVKNYVRDFVLPSFVNTYKIEITDLGDNAAVLGAISLVIYKRSNLRRR